MVQKLSDLQMELMSHRRNKRSEKSCYSHVKIAILKLTRQLFTQYPVFKKSMFEKTFLFLLRI